MTVIMVFDESGNTGHAGRYFVMAGLIANNSRILKKIYKSLPRITNEPKFYRGYKQDITAVLNSISNADILITYIAIDKYSSRYSKVRGNVLYQMALRDLLCQASDMIEHKNVDVFLDSTSFVTSVELSIMAFDVLTLSGNKMKRCAKLDSAQNKCIQLVDHIAGAIRYYYEYGDDTFYKIIENKVSVARRL